MNAMLTSTQSVVFSALHSGGAVSQSWFSSMASHQASSARSEPRATVPLGGRRMFRPSAKKVFSP